MHRVSNKFSGTSNPKPSCGLRRMRGTGPRATGKRGLKHARLQSAPTGVAPRDVSTKPPVDAGDRPPRYGPMKFETCALTKRAYGRDRPPRYVQTESPVHAGDRPPRYVQTQFETCALTKRAYGRDRSRATFKRSLRCMRGTGPRATFKSAQQTFSNALRQ